MARLWSNGFELNSTANNVEHTGRVSGAATTIDSSVVRSGNYSLKVVTSSQIRGGSVYTYLSSASAGVWYIRGYFYIGSLPSLGPCEIATFLDAAIDAKIGIRVTTGGLLQLWNVEDSTQIGSASSALSTGTWHLIELNIDCTTIASTTADARLNGSSFASGSANLTAGVNQLRFWESNSAGVNHNATIYWDDLALNDTTGSFQNSYPGEGNIIHLRPNATGDNTAWSNTFANVSEVTPDNSTTFISSNTNAQLSDFNIDSFDIDNTSIALDAISSGRNSTGNITVSHTTGSFSNRILIATSTVQDGNHANYPVTGITYNGKALTKVRHDEPSGNVRTEIWYLLNPDVGTFNCIKTTTGGVGESTLGVVTLSGVSQVAPEANNGATGTSSSPSVSLTTVADLAWSITVACAETNFTAVNNSQTVLTGYPLTDQSFENADAARREIATAGATTLGYTIGSSQPWAISAISVAPAPAAGISRAISLVQVGARFNGAGASANATFALRIKAAASGTVEESANITPTNTTWVTNAAAAPYNYSLTLYDLPGGSTAAWTKADLDTAQIGVNLVASSTNVARVSTIWLLVEYAAAVGVIPNRLKQINQTIHRASYY